MGRIKISHNPGIKKLLLLPFTTINKQLKIDYMNDGYLLPFDSKLKEANNCVSEGTREFIVDRGLGHKSAAICNHIHTS